MLKATLPTLSEKSRRWLLRRLSLRSRADGLTLRVKGRAGMFFWLSLFCIFPLAFPWWIGPATQMEWARQLKELSLPLYYGLFWVGLALLFIVFVYLPYQGIPGLTWFKIDLLQNRFSWGGWREEEGTKGFGEIEHVDFVQRTRVREGKKAHYYPLILVLKSGELIEISWHSHRERDREWAAALALFLNEKLGCLTFSISKKSFLLKHDAVDFEPETTWFWVFVWVWDIFRALAPKAAVPTVLIALIFLAAFGYARWLTRQYEVQLSLTAGPSR